MSASPIAFVFQVQGDQEAKQKIQSVGGAFQNFGKTTQVVNTQTERMPRNFNQAALGMSAAAASGAALFFQFDNLEKAQQRVEKAQSTLLSSEASLAAAQVTLNRLVERGITSGAQYEAAQLRVLSSEERLRVAKTDVTIAQGDQSEAQLQFALSIVPATIGMVASLTTAHTALIGAKTAETGATLGLSGALGVLRTAMSFVAAHPLILVALGLATVVSLVATNTFGLRDAFDAFGKKVEEIFPFLKPVFDFFRNIANVIAPDTKDATQDMEMGMTNSFQQVGLAGDSMATTVVNDLQIMSGDASKTADEVEKSMARIKESMMGVGMSDSIDAKITRGGGGGSNRGSIFDRAVAAGLISPNAQIIRQTGHSLSTIEVNVRVDDRGEAKVKKSLGIT